MWKILWLQFFILPIFAQGNRDALKFVNKKFQGKLDTNPYFYYHTRRLQSNQQVPCFSDNPYCSIINNKTLIDNLSQKTNDPNIIRMRAQLEQTTLSLVEMIDERKGDKQNYYYADITRTQYDQMIYHKPTQSPTVKPF